MLWILAIVMFLVFLGLTAQLRGHDSTDRLSSIEAEYAASGVIWER